jgi:hypothetical protein
MEALFAVVGLAFVGKQLSDVPEPTTQVQVEKKPEYTRVKNSDIPMFQDEDVRLRAPIGPAKTEMASFSEISADANRFVYGQPVYNLNNRENVSNTMKNLNPNPWNRVGPGIGVGANVPSYGGYQQLAREMPMNVNEHRLTQLPGRIQAPPTSVVPAQETRTTLVGKNRPDKDFYREPMKANGRLVGPETRGKYVRLGYTTKKEQTEKRGEETMNGPRYILNSAYMVTGNQSMVRNLDNRSRMDRSGNPGRMNVRGDPLASGGAVTSVRIDRNSTAMPQGGSQVPMNYVRSGVQEVNPYKDSENPNTRNLDIAKKQLSENIYNHPLV